MPKLDPQAAEQVANYRPESMLDAALALARQGWNVFPLRPGTKVPLIPKPQGRGAHDGTTDEDLIRHWWEKTPNAGIGANLGDDRIAFDIDTYHGGTMLNSFPETRTHWTGRGGDSCHLIYKYEPGSLAGRLKSGTNSLGSGIDIRTGRGSYIVMPPTLHEDTGKPYTLDHVLWDEHTLTDEEVDAIFAEAGGELPATLKAAAKGLAVVSGEKGARGRTPRPMKSSAGTLAGLLADIPSEGGRNDWLTRVCGHLAKRTTNFNEYEQDVLRANLQLAEPLPVHEVQKTLESIWNTEEAKPERALCEDNGFLIGANGRLFCQISTRNGDDTVLDQAPFGDFDLHALGVAVDDANKRLYWLRVEWGGKTWETTLPGAVLGNENQTRVWLAERGMSTDQPTHATPKMALYTRLLRYLNFQNPPEVRIVPTLGWDAAHETFVTHDGAITETGKVSREQAGIVADPGLLERDVAPFSYGFGANMDEAKDVLREILTFQDPTATSLFGAWWAACLLKPQMQERTSIFPFFGVEAASESGKTNGFFDLMVELNGNTRGELVPTRPVLRDYASATRNGIVWADDLDSLDAYGELLRASTSNGTAAKMDADRHGVRNTQIVAPILVTGEALGFDAQKALMDRSVVIGVSSPKGRRSVHDPKKLQWEDVQALRAKYPESLGGLSTLAGWYVQHALKYQRQVLQVLARESRERPGRNGEKLAVLLAGAALLDSLVAPSGPSRDTWEGRGEHYQRVLAWVRETGTRELDQDNTLTMKLLPWAIKSFPGDTAERMERGRFAGMITPVFVKHRKGQTQTTVDGTAEVEIWYSATLLAAAWKRDNNGRIEVRTESEQALVAQGAALGAVENKPVRISGIGKVQRYRRLPDAYVDLVMRRSED